jgi:hypothetical protein
MGIKSENLAIFSIISKYKFVFKYIERLDKNYEGIFQLPRICLKPLIPYNSILSFDFTRNIYCLIV